LEELGCLVQTFYYNRSNAQQQISRVRKQIFARMRLPASFIPDWLRQLAWVWFGLQIGYRLEQEAQLFKPDLVLVLKGEWLLPRTLRSLKRSTAAMLATWWVDNPVLFDERHRWLVFPRCVPIYDHCFVFDYAYFDWLRRFGARNITFLPCAADPTLYRPEVLTADQRCRLESTVCLIGAFYPVRGQIVESLQNMQGLAVWGPGWERFFSKWKENDPRRVWRGAWLPPAELSRAYQASKISFNTHHPQTKRGGLNTRAFEIPASGAFQLMDYVAEMETLLIPGKEVLCFRSPAEAVELTREFIDDAETRSRIARAGYERVLSEHTYRHRMQRLLASI
jgi:spore maturation protein CgeB